MKLKRKNPYKMLFEDIVDFCRKIRLRDETHMFHFPIDKISTHVGWDIYDLHQRTMAANQLGYDVVIKASSDGLDVKYVKKLPEVPYRWR